MTRELSIPICADAAELVEEMTEFLAAAGWRTHFCLGGATAERHVRHRLAPTCVRVPELVEGGNG